MRASKGWRARVWCAHNKGEGPGGAKWGGKKVQKEAAARTDDAKVEYAETRERRERTKLPPVGRGRGVTSGRSSR